MDKKILIGIFAMLVLLLAGCKAPTCYPPNEIIGNNCCLDEDSNAICDYDEELAEQEEEVEEVEEETEEVMMEAEEEETEEETVEEEETEEKEPEYVALPIGLEPGKYEMKMGETKQYLQINKITSYRTSRDKGIMDEIIFTVRNIGDKKLNPVVNLYFEGARIEEHEARVVKEYVLEPLEPGEKHIVKKALGIRFAGINKTKVIELNVYEEFVSPKDYLQVLRKEFVPQDLFESMEIFTYGLPEYE
jgi:hypothetical protein